MSLVQVDYVRAFQDNYIWIIRNDQCAVVVDPGDAKPVFNYLHQKKLKLSAILITHHHADHIGGVQALCDQSNYAVPVYGPAREIIPCLTFPLYGDEQISLDTLGLTLTIKHIPGHTLGHIAYYTSLAHGQDIVFCGDTLFASGCGRLFEGTPAQMLRSLHSLSALPKETLVYCTHEYTLSNIHFAVTVEPNNLALKNWASVAKNLRRQNLPTLPTTLEHELSTNPFLRCQHRAVVIAVQQYIKCQESSELEIFTALRYWKDNFKYT